MATATFLYIGLESQARHHGNTRTFPEHQDGFMGIIYDLDHFAALVDQWSAEFEAGGGCYEAVFDYDIVEPLGAWLHGNLTTCTDEEFIAELVRMVAEWNAA